MKKTTIIDIMQAKSKGLKIPVLTAYDCTMARILDSCGVPIIMVGDSAGMVFGGAENTLAVTMDEMVYHARSVRRGAKNAFVVADMPFGSYSASLADCRKNATRFVKEAGAEAVKLEGGRRSSRFIKAVVEMDVPVMGHIGLTPQSIHRMGGYKVQGKGAAADAIIDDAMAVEEAGAFSVVLEGIPADLARKITERLSIPTIGIGAGLHCDGQVLVINDMLGMNSDESAPRFVRRYSDLRSTIAGAVDRYVKDVQEGLFPSKEESYSS